MNKLDAGFYYVKFRGKWTISYNDGDNVFNWSFCNTCMICNERDFDEIGNKVECPIQGEELTNILYR